MNQQDNILLFRFVKNILFKDRNSKLIFLFLIFFYTLSLLFSHFLSSYKDKFIDKLQSVYPKAYIYTLKDVKPKDDGYIHFKEIFEVNYEGLEFSYKKDGIKNRFTNLAIRSFDKNNIPESLSKYKNDIQNNKNTIYLDQKKYISLTTNKSYNGGIYIKSNKDGKSIFVQIKKFELFDTSSWIVIPNYIANKIFHKNNFDKNVIVSKNRVLYSQQNIKEYYSEYKNLYFWYDSLSFFSKAFYKISTITFKYFNQLFLILISLFAYITLKNIIYEMRKMTLFASRFGKNLLSVTFIYSFGLFIYFSLVVFLSYIFAYFINNLLLDITRLNYQIEFPTVHYIFLILLIIVIVCFFVAYYGRFKQRVDYV
ncbi:MAG: hypothetical protein U9R37_04455 [Campylobacterota bacterium]|nr:hypothetical protein [Campylobacterota bacterium]